MTADTAEAAAICAWTFPISVAIPMCVTTPRQEPLATDVPAKTMLSLLWTSALGSSRGATSLGTASDSPVRLACSIRRVAVCSFTTRMSAGT